MNGRVDAIYTAPAEALPVIRRDRVHARPGIGLDGDRYAHGTGFWSHDGKVSRDLTLIEAEVIEALRTELAGRLDFGALRRNIVTRGVKLNELVGRRFCIGTVVVEGTSLCEPCAHLERIVGRPVLRTLVHRGGVRGNILTMGEIHTGQPISVLVPQVGVGVIVKRSGRYLLGLRKGTERGHLTWSIPGGSVASGETVLDCAVRELQEETGLRAERPRVVSQTFNRLEDGCEWQSIFVAVDVPGNAEPELRERRKCGGWGWFEPSSLPSPLFAPAAAALNSAG
ncbi:MAG: NUDIX domain-containing protein [Acidobacteriaceae bacterium]|nr:NUDIX domain-containing protein [Acidobacteriaceae bacterium]MBV9780840.1 NUDIX domain-containing protein [Acidobacteriaceae bacterium]